MYYEGTDDLYKQQVKAPGESPVDSLVMAAPGGGVMTISKRDRLEHWKGIFKQPGLWKKLEYLFWKTLCPYPDQTRIGMWWYGVSGRIAGYFHSKTCERCNERRP